MDVDEVKTDGTKIRAMGYDSEDGVKNNIRVALHLFLPLYRLMA
jgi:hypothetical protein